MRYRVIYAIPCYLCHTVLVMPYRVILIILSSIIVIYPTNIRLFVASLKLWNFIFIYLKISVYYHWYVALVSWLFGPGLFGPGLFGPWVHDSALDCSALDPGVFGPGLFGPRLQTLKTIILRSVMHDIAENKITVGRPLQIIDPRLTSNTITAPSVFNKPV